MSDTVESLQATRAILAAKYDKVAGDHASGSAGDRTWVNHQLSELRRELDAIDAKLTSLNSVGSGGRTVMRLRRGR